MHQLNQTVPPPMNDTTQTRRTTFPVLSMLTLLLFVGCGAFSSPEPDAMQAVKLTQAMADGITAGNTRPLWDGLSDDCQSDLNQLVHRVAEKMPEPFWKNTMQTAELWGQVLKEKREFALNCPALKDGHSQIEEHGEAIAALLTKLSQSDLRNLEKLNTADVGDLLAQMDPELLQGFPGLLATNAGENPTRLTLQSYRSMLETVASSSFALGRHDEDSAMVHAAYGSGQVTQIPFIKSRGRWVLDVPAEEWKPMMNSANAWIDNLDASSLQLFSVMSSIVNVSIAAQAKDLLKTETQEDFDHLMDDPSYYMLRSFFFAGPQPDFNHREL